MRKLFVTALFIAFTMAATAQKADFQAAEKFSTANLTTRTGDLAVQPAWLEQTDIFWYSYKMPSGRNWWYVDAAKKVKQPLFDSREMAKQLHLVRKKPYDELELPIKELKFEKKSTTRFTFQIVSVKFSYDMVSRALAVKDTIH